MEYSPSREANRSSASQEIPLILWNPKVLYCVHNSPQPVPTLSQLDQVHTPTYKGEVSFGRCRHTWNENVQGIF